MIFVSAYLTSLGVSYPCNGVGRFEKSLSGCLSAKIKASAHSQHHAMDPSMQKLTQKIQKTSTSYDHSGEV